MAFDISQMSLIDNTMSQSKLEVITCRWHEAPENDWERVTIGSGFASDWIKIGASFY